MKKCWGILSLILCVWWAFTPRGEETRSLSSLSKPYEMPSYIHGVRNVPDPTAYNQVVNTTEEYYHFDLQKYPTTLGSIFGKTYRLRADRLEQYSIPDFKYFGTFTVLDDLQKPLFVVRPNQYFLGEVGGKSQYGVRLVPVDDADPVNGAKLVDSYIRDHLQLGPKDLFVAPTYFFQTNAYQSTIANLAANYRIDDGFTHMGAYIGNGQTRNAPNDYHRQLWGVEGYPANFATVSYDGAENVDFQKNFYISLRLLNELNGGVHFSRLEYDRDYYDGNNLKNVFEFYRAWLDHDWVRNENDGGPFWNIITSDVRFDTYCSEHIAMALNVALNLVQSQQGYIEVFGADRDQAKLGYPVQKDNLAKGGEYFWNLAQSRWKAEIPDIAMPVVLREKFTPLWKMPGQRHPKNIPSRNIVKEDPIANTDVLFLDTPGASMAWAPQTLTDVIANFMDMYGRFTILGPSASTQMITSLEGPVLERVNYNDKIPTDIFNSVDSMDASKYQKLISPFVKLIDTYASQIGTLGPQEAYRRFQTATALVLEKYRDPDYLGVDADSFFYYSLPNVIHRINEGMHRYNKYVHFDILGTALPKTHLELQPTQKAK